MKNRILKSLLMGSMILSVSNGYSADYGNHFTLRKNPSKVNQLSQKVSDLSSNAAEVLGKTTEVSIKEESALTKRSTGIRPTSESKLKDNINISKKETTIQSESTKTQNAKELTSMSIPSTTFIKSGEVPSGKLTLTNSAPQKISILDEIKGLKAEVQNLRASTFTRKFMEQKFSKFYKLVQECVKIMGRDVYVNQYQQLLGMNFSNVKAENKASGLPEFKTVEDFFLNSELEAVNSFVRNAPDQSLFSVYKQALTLIDVNALADTIESFQNIKKTLNSYGLNTVESLGNELEEMIREEAKKIAKSEYDASVQSLAERYKVVYEEGNRFEDVYSKIFEGARHENAEMPLEENDDNVYDDDNFDPKNKPMGSEEGLDPLNTSMKSNSEGSIVAKEPGNDDNVYDDDNFDPKNKPMGGEEVEPLNTSMKGRSNSEGSIVAEEQKNNDDVENNLSPLFQE